VKHNPTRLNKIDAQGAFALPLLSDAQIRFKEIFPGRGS
jgi:hypothetical protein